MRIGVIFAAGAAAIVLAAGCAGGERASFATDSEESVTATDEADGTTPEPGAEATTDSSPAATPAPTPTAPPAPTSDPLPAPAVDAFPSRGTAIITLDDGRVYEAGVGCSFTTQVDAAQIRFSGVTGEGLTVEGTFDEAQPDLVVLFVGGLDAGSAFDVFLTNDSGRDDLLQSTVEGTTWAATIALTDPDGSEVVADLNVDCG